MCIGVSRMDAAIRPSGWEGPLFGWMSMLSRATIPGGVSLGALSPDTQDGKRTNLGTTSKNSKLATRLIHEQGNEFLVVVVEDMTRQ